MTSLFPPAQPQQLDSSDRFDVKVYGGLKNEDHDALYNLAVSHLNEHDLDEGDKFLFEKAQNVKVLDDISVLMTSQSVLPSLMNQYVLSEPWETETGQLPANTVNEQEVMDHATSLATSLAARQSIIEKYILKVLPGKTIDGETFASISRNPVVIKRPRDGHQITREKSVLMHLAYIGRSKYIQHLLFADEECIITEFCARRDLMHFMQTEQDNSKHNIPTATLAQLLIMGDDIFRGLEYLHLNGLAHNDMKPENVLLTSEMQIKVADFEHCSYQNEKCFSTARTKGYESAQGLGFQIVNNELKWTNCVGCPIKGDVFAAGLTVAFLLCRLHPLQMKCESCSKMFIGMCKCMDMPETLAQKKRRFPVLHLERSIDPFVVAKPYMPGKPGMYYLIKKLQKYGQGDYDHITIPLTNCFAVMDSERPNAADVTLFSAIE